VSLFTDATLLLSLTANAGLGIAVAHLVERRRRPKPKPDKPRAVNRAPKVHTAPAHLPVVYQEVTRLSVLDGDVTEVRDPTRLDLLKQHTERGWRARRSEG
jgi:hypothetical protein